MNDLLVKRIRDTDNSIKNYFKKINDLEISKQVLLFSLLFSVIQKKITDMNVDYAYVDTTISRPRATFIKKSIGQDIAVDSPLIYHLIDEKFKLDTYLNFSKILEHPNNMIKNFHIYKHSTIEEVVQDICNDEFKACFYHEQLEQKIQEKELDSKKSQKI